MRTKHELKVVASGVTPGFHLPEGLLSTAIALTGMGLWFRDPDSKEFNFDHHACRIHGFDAEDSRMVKASYLRQVHLDDQAELNAAFENVECEAFLNLEYRWHHADGSTRWLVCSGKGQQESSGRWAFVGTVFDVSQRKELEEQLVRSQKMEAVGQLTAGIAHNFNNILSAILPSLDLASNYVQPEGGKFLRNAKLAAERAGELVSELMIVAGRRGDVHRGPLDLVLIVERIVRICRTTFGVWVHLDFELEEEVPFVIGNESQLEQVLLNLLINSRDALEESLPSCPRISVELVPNGQREILFKVSDNGPGMDSQSASRAFDPFFSTKESGTGLGLATARAIIGEHGGTIAVRSEVEQGCCIEILLPACTEPNA